jgi:hypothetical protein
VEVAAAAGGVGGGGEEEDGEDDGEAEGVHGGLLHTPSEFSSSLPRAAGTIMSRCSLIRLGGKEAKP